MRLRPSDIDAIKSAAMETFGADAVVRLFGSRVHDHLRGGDIDLHVEVSDFDRSFAARSRFLAILHRSIGERSIDVLLQERDGPASGIDIEARRTGVVL